MPELTSLEVVGLSRKSPGAECEEKGLRLVDICAARSDRQNFIMAMSRYVEATEKAENNLDVVQAREGCFSKFLCNQSVSSTLRDFDRAPILSPIGSPMQILTTTTTTIRSLLLYILSLSLKLVGLLPMQSSRTILH